MCPSLWAFFGLSDDYLINLNEIIFQMKYFGGWSFIEAYNLPVQMRNWYYDRLMKQLKKEADAINNPSK